MTPASLKDRIRFERRRVDVNGDATGPFERQFVRFANLLYLRGSEPVLAQRLQGIQPAVITVHADPATRGILNTWRAVDDRLPSPGPSDFFAIRGVVPSPDGAWVEITAERGADG